MLIKNLKVGKILAAILLFVFVYGAPLVIFAAPSPTAAGPSAGACVLTSAGLAGVVGCVIGILEVVLGLLIAGGVVLTVFGAFQMIGSEEKREAGKQRVYYGIIGIFVMVSVWGFVRILTNTFKLDNSVITPTALRKE